MTPTPALAGAEQVPADRSVTRTPGTRLVAFGDGSALGRDRTALRAAGDVARALIRELR